MARHSDEVRTGTAANSAAPHLTTAELKTQIESTRAQMSQTIDAIQDRLRPKRVLANAKDSIKEAAINRVTAVRERPLPAAVAGVSLMTLTAAAVRRRRRRAALGRPGGGLRLPLLIGLTALAAWAIWRRQRA